MEEKRVLVTEEIDPRALAYLRRHCTVVQGDGADRAAAGLSGCQGVLVRSARITAELLEQNPQLRVVAKHGMGLDAIDVAAATARGVAVVNAPTSNLNAVSEHIVMLLLALSKRAVLMDRLTRYGAFGQRNAHRTAELKGSTVGFVGMGRIARLTVKKLSGLELRVIASDPFVRQEDVAGLPVKMVTPGELYAEADYVVVHTSLTPATRHLVGEAEFRAMKPTACIVNAARGAVLDEAALIRALREGEIAGAGLDVFEQEPPAPDNPLLAMDNVVLSPHNAALSEGALLAMAMDSAEGVVDWLEGRVPRYLCNPEILEHAPPGGEEAR